MVKPIDLKPPKELRTLIAQQLEKNTIPFSKSDLATVTSLFELLKKLTAETTQEKKEKVTTT